MTPQLLREAGEALYGSQWPYEMARGLDVAVRTVLRWASGTNEIPSRLCTEIQTLIGGHVLRLAAVAAKLAKEA